MFIKLHSYYSTMDDFEWSVSNESKLFEAMVGYKPVGFHKHFEMACILDRLSDLDVDVSATKVWEHLSELYNLEALDSMDPYTVPQDEREFYLPEVEYGTLKVKKEEKIDDKSIKQNLIKRNETKEPPKVIKEVKKEEKTAKKDGQRRDSKDGKDAKVNTSVKKEIKKDDKLKQLKGRNSVTVKEEEKSRTPKPDEANKRLNKRPTRGSMKPEETSGKSQSPLTVPSLSSGKRRRI